MELVFASSTDFQCWRCAGSQSLLPLRSSKAAFHCFGWAKAVLQVCSIYSGYKMHVADQGMPARGAAEPGFLVALQRGTWVLDPH